MGWTEEKVSELTKLWDEGITTGEIGKRLGVSKTAVVGKAHRLKLKGRPSPIKRSSSVNKKAKEIAKPKNAKLSILDLTAITCRWPIGDPENPDFHFCGKKAVAGKPYCKEHSELAYVVSTRRGSGANGKKKRK